MPLICETDELKIRWKYHSESNLCNLKVWVDASNIIVIIKHAPMMSNIVGLIKYSTSSTAKHNQITRTAYKFNSNLSTIYTNYIHVVCKPCCFKLTTQILKSNELCPYSKSSEINY